ncbi:tyrosine-protein phosphatase [Vagococcus bubulae]|uniref:Tyrosine specific protein phosphatases domain-containing protein n=1 Tax=Vagococcus bubulae TaxID=1977868 RepID=A0A429ZPI3_9ENTE|nr:tyrosine-protein phosphatase [Vagococcus bubulae]RST95539.1 hypothetical protein CBF36_02325 [Vagococcus bubulae]
MYYQRLPLETTYNTRDLGGIPTKSRNMVAWKKLFRSDDVCRLTENDVAFLEDYGVGAVIDLRTEKERQDSDYPLERSSMVKNYHIPFVVDENIQDISQSTVEMTLYDFYEQMILEQQSIIKELFMAIYESKDTGLIFHCAAGKDRTGVLALLLLGLLEVDEKDIIANYETSYTYLSANEDLISPEGYEHLMYSDRENMERLLPLINERYGTVFDYLKECGLSEEMLLEIKKAYTQEV